MNSFKTKFKLYKKNKYASFSLTKQEEIMLQLYAQMILDEACYSFNKNRLQKLIDDALSNNNLNEFILLSQSYNKLLNSNT